MELLLTEWQYVVDPSSDEPTILINKHIGTDPEDGPGIVGDIFEKELTLLDGMGKKAIHIYINSHGGSVDDGFSIFNSILRCSTPTCTYVSGIAASIAGVIFQAGKTRKIYDYGILMIHNPFIKNSDESIEENKVLKIIKESLVVMLKTGTKLTKEAISTLMDEETWMNAEEAVKYGLADEIIECGETIEETDLDNMVSNEVEIENKWRKFDIVLNKLVIKNKKIDMINKLKKMLNLSQEATELDVLNAVKISMPFLFEAHNDADKCDEDEAKMENKTDLEEPKMEDEIVANEDGDEDEDEDEDDYKNEVKNLYNGLLNEIKSLRKEIENLKKPEEAVKKSAKIEINKTETAKMKNKTEVELKATDETAWDKINFHKVFTQAKNKK